MHSIDDVANWFLANVDNLTPKKLQKLVYYAYAWYITFNNDTADHIENRFFNARPEAWIHGPVFPTLYQKYKIYGGNVIEKYNGDLAAFNDDELDLLEQVREVYGNYTGNQLESITHQEDPWRAARNGIGFYDACNCKIDDAIIFECYSKRLAED